MNLANIIAIYRKELLETLRDRKTLLFMFLLPTVLMPLVMMGISRLAIQTVGRAALSEVIVVAEPATRDAYLELAHDQFLATPVATFLRWATHPFARLITGNEAAEALQQRVPREIFRDPAAYQAWTQQLAEDAGKSLADPGGLMDQIDAAAQAAGAPTGAEEIPEDALELPQPGQIPMPGAGNGFALAAGGGGNAASTLLTAIQSVGLVRFVDPADLTAAISAEDRVGTSTLPIAYTAQIRASIRNREAHAFLLLEGDPNAAPEESGTSIRAQMLYNSTIQLSGEAANRVRQLLNAANEQVVEMRLARRGLPPAFLEPVRVTQEENIASQSQQVFSILGGLLPYLIITFAYLGAFYPAIDIGAGEKERQTLETLLLTPVARLDIALGKYLVLLTTSLVASLLGVISMALSLWLIVPAGIVERLNVRVEWGTMLPVALLALPPSAIFAGAFLSISIFARSFKEAQNYMTPLGFLAILPAAAALIPGVEMNTTTAFVPFVNLSLLARDFLKGDINWLYYGITLGTSVLLAAICLAYSAWQFHRERVLFRT